MISAHLPFLALGTNSLAFGLLLGCGHWDFDIHILQQRMKEIDQDCFSKLLFTSSVSSVSWISIAGWTDTLIWCWNGFDVQFEVGFPSRWTTGQEGFVQKDRWAALENSEGTWWQWERLSTFTSLRSLCSFLMSPSLPSQTTSLLRLYSGLTMPLCCSSQLGDWVSTLWSLTPQIQFCLQHWQSQSFMF